jgi:hypothetical protein
MKGQDYFKHAVFDTTEFPKKKSEQQDKVLPDLYVAKCSWIL